MKVKRRHCFFEVERFARLDHPVNEVGGSISAEHGLGQKKREEITKHKSGVELDMKRAINAALDPKRIMSLEKVLSRND